MIRIIGGVFVAIFVVFLWPCLHAAENAAPMTLGKTSGRAVSLCVSGKDPDMRRAADRWKAFFIARKIPVKVFDSSKGRSVPEGPVIAFETKEQAPMARAVGADLSQLKTGLPESYLMIAKQRKGHPLILIVGETSKGTDCGAAWLQSKVSCVYDKETKKWSATIKPINELRQPFFRGREATLCPTGRILRGDTAKKINFELWSKEQLKRYPGFLKACGFNSIQVMELLKYRGGARREQVAPAIHTLADATHQEGMSVSQYIWGSADGFRWDDPKTRKQREQRYIGLAKTYGKYVDHIITHWKDEGYEDGYVIPQEATAFLLEQYKKYNPDIRVTQDAWFNGRFWSAWKGSKSKTFLDEAYTPKQVGIALERWYDAKKAALVKKAGRPVGIWGWYMGDFEMNYSSHILTRTIHKYYSALPPEASRMVDWISIELCFHTLPSQVNLYVGGQMMCDPKRSLDQIMFDYCHSVYGVANAQTMTEVYKVVEMGQKEYRYGMVKRDRYPKVHSTPEFTGEAKSVLGKLERVELPVEWQPNFPTVSDPRDDIKSLRQSLEAFVRGKYPKF